MPRFPSRLVAVIKQLIGRRADARARASEVPQNKVAFSTGRLRERFCKMFHRQLGWTAAAMLPKQAGGTFRKHFTKPFPQPATQDLVKFGSLKLAIRPSLSELHCYRLPKQRVWGTKGEVDDGIGISHRIFKCQNSSTQNIATRKMPSICQFCRTLDKRFDTIKCSEKCSGTPSVLTSILKR